MMKSKKGAFANTSTGYGKRYNSSSPKTANKSIKSGEVTTKKAKNVDKTKEKPKIEDQDTELNSGFGNYLRSNEGVEMMKMFVFANTIMLIITMAWPHFKEQYHWLIEWWYSLAQDS